MTRYDYAEPGSVEEALALLAEHGDDAHLIAGGASLILMLRQQLVTPRLLVGLRRIDALRGIRSVEDGSLEIGATTTHRMIEGSADVRAYEPALAAAVGQVATVRVRNQGTLGGNLAHADPAQDPPPILMALDAQVRVASIDGSREIPVADLFADYFETTLEPGEVITSIVLPPRPSGAAAVYLKFLPGSKDDYATVSVASSGRRDGDRWTDIRIACGSAGPVPLRIAAAEAAVEGTALEGADVARAAEAVGEAVEPIDDVRGSADYKREMAMVWTRRALRRLASGGRTDVGSAESAA